MSTTVNTSQNTVTFTATNNTVSVTNNNTGTSVDIIGTDITTVSVGMPGPKGDKGQQSYNDSDDLTLQDLSLRNVTASGDISASGDLLVDTIKSNQLFIKNAAGTENIITGNSDSSVQLYYNNAEKFNTAPGGINVTGNITASGDISSSGNIYSDNIQSIPLSFEASGDADLNWHGPNKQGPYYYVYNYDYGDNNSVKTLAQQYAVAGIYVPYKATLAGLKGIVSHKVTETAVTIALYTASSTAPGFNNEDATANDITIGSALSITSATPGAPENPMSVKVSTNLNLSEGDLIYPRIRCGAEGAYGSFQILLKRRK